MKTKDSVIPSEVSVILTNSKQQSFDLCFRPVNSISDIQAYISPRHGLSSELIITSALPLHKAVPFNFDAVLIKVDPQGLADTVSELQTDHSALLTVCCTAEEYEKGFFYLLVRPFIARIFEIKKLTTSFIRKEKYTYLTPYHELSEEFKASSDDEIIQALLRQQEGEGLRSEFPYAYVWYHDLLFVVLKTSIPGYAASRINDDVTNAYLKLVKSGLNPIPVEAIYHRPFIKSVYKATARHTWSGIQGSYQHRFSDSLLKTQTDLAK